MNLTQDMHRIEHWADTHHPVWVDFLRMALGIFLFVKGVMFIQDTEALQNIMHNSQFQWVSFGMAHYVAFAHLVGGLLIAMGLVTRIAILFQLPILLGAVFFINPQRGFYSENTELWSSIIVLILLVVFLILGSGRLSVDNLISRPERDVLY
ncbi:DoxX family protein [Pontibacter sp. HSC-14F20]|uniref:DoxX family protein n=1 Tax=Pontibacter sp. HSC-14F20 TaxID=2864136 RepID=UPI001C72F5EB|nr:DoxX family protein [Pontibacter sp. HSC-14F20]MBX0331785.1 DoxX family protein [Pontibacter sp. HSC-14F20]